MFSSNSSLKPMMSTQNHNPIKDWEVMSPPDDSISCLAFSPPSHPQNYLMNGSRDNQIKCWELTGNSQTNTCSQPKTQPTHFGPVLDVALSDDGTTLCSASCDNINDNKDHNHYREEANSDLESNSSNSDNNLNDNNKSKTVTEYEVEKYCEQKWESVNGTYDAETEWRPWNSMTSAVSYGHTLHILPYVDIDLTFDQNSDSE